MTKMIMTTAILAVLGGAAAAQSRNCGPRAHVVERLTDQYGETRQSIGLAANNSVVEVYASTQTGTWTITVTMPSGVTCLVAAGRNFEELAEAQPAAGDDV